MKDHSIYGYLERQSLENLQTVLNHYQSKDGEKNKEMIAKICDIIEKKTKVKSECYQAE